MTNDKAYPFQYCKRAGGYEFRVWRPDCTPHHFGHYKSEAAAQRSADRINIELGIEARGILESLRRDTHTGFDDTYYSCPKHPDYSGPEDSAECDCGMDDTNAKVNEALVLLAQNTRRQNPMTDKMRLESLEKQQEELEAIWADFCQAGMYDDPPIPLLQMSAFEKLCHAIAKILEA